MTDLYLGLIALGVIVMATIQVAAFVIATRAIGRIGAMADRFEQDVRPILVNLQKVSEEAARASAQAAAQVDRLDALVSNVARRVEETAATVQQAILQPARDGLALLAGLKNIIAGFREPRDTREARPAAEGQAPREAHPSPARPAHHGPADDELFIG
jgi:hypothetical protein